MKKEKRLEKVYEMKINSFCNLLFFELVTIKEKIKNDYGVFKHNRAIKSALKHIKKCPDIPDSPEFVYSRVAKVFDRYDWLNELPLDRISENCKNQIRELILVDINEQLEEQKNLVLQTELNDHILESK
ncbi:hypothetical protein M0P65_06080 [Candidatus Gracilibacteria bacterium]|jgi:hypothetical protein|nr:hypothetical protein [Candidatus Gracilibacteria bacterium]